MKLTKNEFKSMIKDCIKELLTEGAFDQALSEAAFLTESPQKRPMATPQKKPQGQRPSAPMVSKNPIDRHRARDAARRMVGADDYRYGPGFGEETPEDFDNVTIRQQAPGLQRLVESTAEAVAKGNPKMAEQYAAIFADTAVNTLPKQMAGDSNRSGYGGMAGLGAHTQIEKVNERDIQSLAPQGDMSHWAQLAFGVAGRK